MEATSGMDAPPIPTPEKPKFFTVQEARKRFIDSFYFSQGSEEQQNDIIQYAAIRSTQILPTDPNFLGAFHTSSIEAIKHYLNSNTKGGYAHGIWSVSGTDSSHPLRGGLTTQSAATQIERPEKHFVAQMSKSAPPLKPVDQLIEEITTTMIMKDYKYIAYPMIRKGRPRKEMSLVSRIKGIGKKQPDKTYHPRKDKYLSQFLYYGLLGNPTGTPEYDLMFADIAQWYRDVGKERLDRKVADDDSRSGFQMLESVARVFNERHPNMQVTI